MEVLENIRKTGAIVTPVGSRVTCNPAPTNTDEDYLVELFTPDISRAVEDCLSLDGWEIGGSQIPDEASDVPVQDRFYACRNGDINLIVTRSQTFAHRFLAATSIAKRLNLLNKADRIALFQAVLYGRIDVPTPVCAELDEVEF